MSKIEQLEAVDAMWAALQRKLDANRAVMQQALEALEEGLYPEHPKVVQAITALKEQLK